jgi:hypothetical protein
MWARNGRELFYVDANGTLTSIGVGAGPAWSATGATKIAAVPVSSAGPGRSHDVAPDGKRFLIIKRGASDAPVNAARARNAEAGMIVVQNWDQELRRLVPKP